MFNEIQERSKLFTLHDLGINIDTNKPATYPIPQPDVKSQPQNAPKAEEGLSPTLFLLLFSIICFICDPVYFGVI